MRRPVDAPFTITTKFGVPDSNALFKYHSGVDYAVATGRLIYAPASGTVVFARFHNVRGNMVCIFDGTYTHRLMHNSSFAVSEGQRVSEGQVVAYAGSTGLSTGPHCHWDVMRGNKVDATSFSDFVNPADLLASQPNPQGDINVETIKSMYWRLLGREADQGGIEHYTQQVKERGWEFVYLDLKNSAPGQADWDRRNPERVRTLEAQAARVDELGRIVTIKDNEIARLQKELEAAQNKPAQVIEKEVIKEVPVYTHDQKTADDVSAIRKMVTSIFDYFVGQYKTFSKYIKK